MVTVPGLLFVPEMGMGIVIGRELVLEIVTILAMVTTVDSDWTSDS